MAVRQIDPNDKRQRKRFIDLERELRATSHCTSMRSNPMSTSGSARSPFYEEMEHTLFLASNGRDLARCAALVNRRWQRDNDEQAGFIGYFAAAQRATAEVREMLEAAERWLSERGADRAITPFNGDFSSERYRAVSKQAIDDARCEVRPLDKKRWKEEVETLRSVFNDTFRTEWEFHA